MGLSKVDEWLIAENLTKVKGWFLSGLTEQQVAHNMGIGLATLVRWKSKYPEFAEAVKRSKEVIDFEVENALYKSAVGYYVDDYDKQGNPIKRYIPPNTTAQIFWLKNRKRDVWRDKQDVEVSGTVGIADALTQALERVGINDENRDEQDSQSTSEVHA